MIGKPIKTRQTTFRGFGWNLKDVCERQRARDSQAGTTSYRLHFFFSFFFSSCWGLCGDAVVGTSVPRCQQQQWVEGARASSSGCYSIRSVSCFLRGGESPPTGWTRAPDCASAPGLMWRLSFRHKCCAQLSGMSSRAHGVFRLTPSPLVYDDL